MDNGLIGIKMKIEFSNYAITLWDQVVINRRQNKERSVETWE